MNLSSLESFANRSSSITFSLINGAPSPYPPNPQKMLCFLQYKKRMGCSFSTLKNYYHCLSSVFKQDHNIDLSDDKDIKKYFQALNREMLGQSFPFATNAITKDNLLKIFQMMNMENFYEIRDIACFCLQFEGMLRVSEIIALELENVTFSEQRAAIFIRRTKTDQNGLGRTIYITKSDSHISAYNRLKYYLEKRPQSSCPKLFLSRHDASLTSDTLRRSLKKWIGKIGLDQTGISTHSLRKGGCKCAFNHFVPAPAIQHQGGWSSACFLRYGKMEAEEAADLLQIAFQ